MLRTLIGVAVTVTAMSFGAIPVAGPTAQWLVGTGLPVEAMQIVMASVMLAGLMLGGLLATVVTSRLE
jgi:hypothetical protein